jgi:hypothetical protein
MTKGVQISYLWHDVDVIKIRVRIENDDFSGAADLYVGHGDLRAAGKKLKGFPKDSRDERQFELGSFGNSPAGGGSRPIEFPLQRSSWPSCLGGEDRSGFGCSKQATDSLYKG